MNNSKYRKVLTAVLLLAVFAVITSTLPAKVFAGENVPVEAEIKVTYIVDGNVRAAGGGRFTLSADDPRSPMPDGCTGGKKEITVTDEGSFSFGVMRYERPDVHWYTVTRDVIEKKGVIKDHSVYKAKVIALNDGHGYVLVYKNGSDEKNELVYLDRVAPATGDDISIVIYSVIAGMAAASLAVFALKTAKNRRRERR